MRNLMQHPCWSARDLGQALPDSPHAVSVALPRWQDVIDYEEKNAACIEKLQAIYPRFGLNPLVAEVAQLVLKHHGLIDSTAWPYPNVVSAKKAQSHCQRQKNNSKTSIIEFLGLQCLIADNQATPPAKAFWQHAGLGASSRQAAIALNKEETPSDKEGSKAKEAIRQRLAKIYNCEAEVIKLHPSGMASLTTALEAIKHLNPGRPTLQLGFPYVDVLKLPKIVFEGSDLLLKTDPEYLASELDQRKPSAVIVELPSNPMLECVDMPTIAKLAHERDIPVIADDTIGSGLNINALPYADLIFSSLTKSFAGRGDILAGALIISPNSRWKNVLIKNISSASFTSLSNADAIALEKTSRDVDKRIPQLNEACSALKRRLEKHPAIARVHHPGKCPNFKALMRPGAGYGCLLSFELVEGLKKAQRFYDALKVCKGPSLGTSFTLVCPYVLLAHYDELDWAESCGLPAHLLRVSVGLENQEQLWKRFEKALQS